MTWSEIPQAVPARAVRPNRHQIIVRGTEHTVVRRSYTSAKPDRITFGLEHEQDVEVALDDYLRCFVLVVDL